jgi:UDP-glucose 6-dehydrogenase
MNRFGIVGYGIVGKATHLSLLDSADIKICDPAIDAPIENLKDCEYVFFSTPTVTQDDIKKLIKLIVEVKSLNNLAVIIIRNTLPVGTGSVIQDIIQDKILYIPEFLRDRVWEEDSKRGKIIVGHDGADIPDWLQSKNPTICSLIEAEILKMFSNNYAASRIVFANHFYELSKKFNADYTSILDMFYEVEHDQSYLEANENLRGFGGKCLTKDLDFIIDTFKQLGINQTYFDAIKADNQQWPITIRKS